MSLNYCNICFKYKCQYNNIYCDDCTIFICIKCIDKWKNLENKICPICRIKDIKENENKSYKCFKNKVYTTDNNQHINKCNILTCPKYTYLSIRDYLKYYKSNNKDSCCINFYYFLYGSTCIYLIGILSYSIILLTNTLINNENIKNKFKEEFSHPIIHFFIYLIGIYIILGGIILYCFCNGLINFLKSDSIKQTINSI